MFQSINRGIINWTREISRRFSSSQRSPICRPVHSDDFKVDGREKLRSRSGNTLNWWIIDAIHCLSLSESSIRLNIVSTKHPTFDSFIRLIIEFDVTMQLGTMLNFIIPWFDKTFPKDTSMMLMMRICCWC